MSCQPEGSAGSAGSTPPGAKVALDIQEDGVAATSDTSVRCNEAPIKNFVSSTVYLLSKKRVLSSILDLSRSFPEKIRETPSRSRFLRAGSIHAAFAALRSVDRSLSSRLPHGATWPARLVSARRGQRRGATRPGRGRVRAKPGPP